jgi:hypothetical protein
VTEKASVKKKNRQKANLTRGSKSNAREEDMTLPELRAGLQRTRGKSERGRRTNGAPEAYIYEALANR